MKKKCKSHCADSHKIRSGLGLAAVRGPPRSVAERTRRRLTSRGRGARRDCGGALLRRSSLTGRHTSKSICGGHRPEHRNGDPAPGDRSWGGRRFPQTHRGWDNGFHEPPVPEGGRSGEEVQTPSEGFPEGLHPKTGFFWASSQQRR